jgi:hypothetical protein
MKVAHRLAVALIAATAGAAAFAQEATPDTWMNASVSNSRAQVQQELDQARKDGSLHYTSEGYDFVALFPSTKSREQVRAELSDARLSGEYGSLNAEAHAFGTIRMPAHASL